MLHPRTPVLVAGAQFTQRTAREGKLLESLNPIGLLAKASWDALGEVGAPIARAIDTVAVVRFTADSMDGGRLPNRMFRNPPLSLAKKLGLQPRRALYGPAGGNTPQWLVNRIAEDIANGECEAALIAGAEYLATLLGAMRQNVHLGWNESPDCDPGADADEIGDNRTGTNEYERSYGLNFPVNVYPLFENAIRGIKKHSPSEHLEWLGRFFSPFSKVASENPYSWFPVARTPEEISTPSNSNRFVGFPYTKYLNAVIEVDMAASLIMTSVEKARELGIPESKWIYLRGCADAADIWNVTGRVNYHSSPAMRMMGNKAFAMADLDAGDLDFIDLYSCFPSAVELACQELDIAEDDPRGLTITGGLPYFGGPGNNYVMHSIVAMAERLRTNPGRYGLCTGNGWYVTKHSAGIYSTEPPQGAWQRENPETYQRELDAMPHPRVIEKPQGKAKVETYTVVTDRKGRRFGLTVGRLENGVRFLAHTDDDDATLTRMTSEEILGREGSVAQVNNLNLFRFA
jgi:acetyl-CoA C-acetyltransferase